MGAMDRLRASANEAVMSESVATFRTPGTQAAAQRLLPRVRAAGECPDERPNCTCEHPMCRVAQRGVDAK